jgi:chemotaxis family two-component system response regulator Rcp1
MNAEVLLVEDSDADVFLFKKASSQWKRSLKLLILRDGEEAVSLIQSATFVPVLIVLDLNLPKKSGFEILTEIKLSNKWKDIPVVIFTGSNRPEESAKAYQLKANRFVQKPSDLGEYMKIVAEMENLVVHQA